MASENTTSSLTKILESIDSVREEIQGLRADLTGQPTVRFATKLERKKSNAPPSNWRVFSDHVRSILKNAGYEGRALGVEAMQFTSSLKEEEPDLTAWSDEEILARRKTWNPPTVSSGETADGKKERKSPWADLTAEQRSEKLERMKEARAEKKAASFSTPPSEYKPVMILSERYLVNMATGHTYHRNSNGSKGAWAGLFKKDPKPRIDTSVPEPTFGGGKRKSTRKHKQRHMETRKH
jgi:hypothetical protein